MKETVNRRCLCIYNGTTFCTRPLSYHEPSRTNQLIEFLNLLSFLIVLDSVFDVHCNEPESRLSPHRQLESSS